MNRGKFAKEYIDKFVDGKRDHVRNIAYSAYLAGMKKEMELQLEKNSNAEMARLIKYSPIEDELDKARMKHPDWPSDMFRQVAIMNEESGEVTKAVLHYHYENGSLDDVRNELIQTAAMCMRMMEAL